MDEKMTNVHEALRWASLFLQKHSREEKVAEILMQYHVGMDKSRLLASLREPLEPKQKRSFIRDVEKHAKTGIPVQHLTGKEMFYGREFYVDKHVLIPRPETEELVEGVLAEIRKRKSEVPLRLVDLGTGSGIIAITLKLEHPDLEVVASDISEEALSVARKNATRLDAEVEFCQGDFLQPFIDKEKKFDLIVSNPPYIAEKERESLSGTVKNFDPGLALFAEDEGLAAYRKILEQTKKTANPGALAAFEIGENQGHQVKGIVEEFFPDASAAVKKDINGKERMVFARLSTENPHLCG